MNMRHKVPVPEERGRLERTGRKTAQKNDVETTNSPRGYRLPWKGRDRPAPQTTLAPVVGITWNIRTKQLGRPLPEIRIGDRVGTAPHAEAGAPSLLLLLAEALLQETTVSPGRWLFVAPYEDEVWTAVAEIDQTPRPVPGPERLHATPAEALRVIREEAEIAPLAGTVLTTPRLEEELRALGIPVLTLAPEYTSDQPVFLPARGLPLKEIVVGGLALSFLTAFVSLGLPLITAALKPPPPPPAVMVAVAPQPADFRDACEQGLSEWWPRVAGWRAKERGCALMGHFGQRTFPLTPATDLTLPVVIWQEMVQSGQVNAVLATGAADRMLRTWPHASQQTPDTLILWRQVDIPLLRQTETPTNREQIIRTLAGRFADTPNAVSHGPDGSVVVTAPGPTLLARAASSLMPLRLTLPADGLARLRLAPYPARLVPATLFDMTQETPE